MLSGWKSVVYKCHERSIVKPCPDLKTKKICPAGDNPYHTFIDYGVMDTNVKLKSQGGTGGYSKCYSEDSCMQMLMIEKGWITSPTCTTCGRRRADEEYVTMNLEV